MKFSSTLAYLAASGAASASILERQVQTIIGVVNTINTITGDLDTTIKGFTSDPKALLAATQKVQDAVLSGVSTVNGASTITLTDSVQIQGQVQNLQSTIESVVSGLIAKKEALVSAGQGQIIYKSLEEQLTGAKALQVAISSKVPPEVQTLAQTLSQGINTALEKGITAFKDAPGAASGSGSSSSSSSPSSGSSSVSSSSGSSSSGSSSGSSGSSSSSSTGSDAKPKPASAAGGASAATTSSAPKPATYTGAAAPRAIAGSVAIAFAIGAVVFAL
jgi:hypothetical protein